MKILPVILLFLCCATRVSAQKSVPQKLDSLFFNLYTDSLKKGTYNYINVDGKFSDGRYLPMTSKELIFSADAGKFDGNSLFLEPGLRSEKIVVKVTLKSDTSIYRERTIFVKKYEDNSGLKTMEEVMRPKGRHM